eukprot:5945763-Pyramimonas_sp.AAC.1
MVRAAKVPVEQGGMSIWPSLALPLGRQTAVELPLLWPLATADYTAYVCGSLRGGGFAAGHLAQRL